jgi:hypothetical protein
MVPTLNIGKKLKTRIVAMLSQVESSPDGIGGSSRPLAHGIETRCRQ